MSLTSERRGVESIREYPIAPDEESTIRWDGIRNAIRAAIESVSLEQPVEVSVSLHGRHVRYRLVPWQADLTSPELRGALAQHCFVDAFGDAARLWSVVLSDTDYGKTALACAIEAGLLEAIRDAVRQAKGRLDSVSPLLMTAFNLALRNMRDEQFWFVLVEPARLTMILWREGTPILLRAADAKPTTLGFLLDREWVAAGIEDPVCPVYVCDAQGKQPIPIDAGRWSAHIDRLPRSSESRIRKPRAAVGFAR